MSAMVRLLVAMPLSLALVSPLFAMAPSAPTGRGEKVALFSCSVMFAFKTSASSGTDAGLFDNSRRSDVTVTSVYELAGVDTASFQQITDRLCASTAARLKETGYDVVEETQITSHKRWEDMDKKGDPSGKKVDVGEADYRVYAPTGKKIMDGLVIGGMSGFQLRGLQGSAANEWGAKALNVVYVVDFATVEGKKDRFKTLGGQNWAEVKANVVQSVTATMTLLDPTGAKCWNRFGKYECDLNKALKNLVKFESDQPVASTDAVLEVKDVGSGAGKAAMAAVNAVALLGGSRRRKLNQYEVQVDQSKYVAHAEAAGLALLDDGMKFFGDPAAQEAAKKKKK